jgi:hypothetical protein
MLQRIVVVGLAVWALTVPTSAQGPNLAANPGFEDWPEPPAGAAAWGASSYTVGVAGRDGGGAGRAYRSGEGELDTERHAGKYAQYLQTTTWGRGAIARGLPVTAGHRYRASVWVKVLSGKFQLGVCFAHAPWTYLGDWEYALPRNEWARVVKEVTIPEGCQSIATVMFLQTGSAYLDDLEIVDLGPAREDDPAADKLPLLPGKLAPQITRQRIALFVEPGFPSESPRDATWYETVLKGAGLQVTPLDSAALGEADRFSRERFDTLILPTGGNFPAPAEAAIETFLAGGGTVLVDESLVLRTAPRPDDDVARELERLRQEYLAGNGGYPYFDYLSRHLWAPHGNMFERDPQAGMWRTQLNRSQNYEYLNPAYYPEGLGLRCWPNDARPIYARPLSEPLARNDVLGAMLADFPASVPADEKPATDRGALRLCREGNPSVDPGVAPEYACDLLLCLYTFAQPSGRSYPAFPDAGKSPRDREGDFYLLRTHHAGSEGGTLLHFGSVGARLLAGPDGAAVVLASLRLAESELPGECPPEYVRTVNEARELYSRYSGESLAYRGLLADAASVAAYAGKAADLANVKAAHAREQERFEGLSRRWDDAEKLLAKRDGDCAYGHAARVALVADLRAETERLDKAAAEVRLGLRTLRPPAPVAPKSPFGHLYFGLDNTQARGARGLAEFRRRIEQMGLRYEGYHLTSYRHEYTFTGHPFKREVDSGVLDPATGVIKPKKDHWPETPEDRAAWQESFRWQLERVNRDPETTSIYGMDERDFEWSLWGPRDRLLFLEYLQKKYGDVGKLNALWATKHASFADIQLPVTRPQMQPEHACWEDWTRFREVYRLEREIRLSTETVLRYAPDRKWRYLTWCTYNQHGVQPANGINFYEYGKELPVNGFEHSNEDAKEWLAFDICSMFSKHVTAEWGAFYFPPATHQARVDLLSERLWKGLANGQAGWSLYAFSAPRWGAANFVGLLNHPLPPGWQLAEIKRRADRIEHVLLDGEREESPVRIVYSPTTRRHTSWPGVESDISYRANGGLYALFRNSHLHARSIDEQAVWEGHLPRECRLLILPEVLYENEALHAKATEYLRAGGSVLVTPGSGRFDQYGRLRNAWLKLAGVVPQSVSEKVIPLADGVRYFSSAHADRMVALQPVFPDEVEVLARFAGGQPAVTETRVGKGRLFVAGCDLGLDAHDQYQGNPGPARALLAPVLQRAGVTQEVTVSRSDIMVRPWRHQGRRYLMLASTGREGLSEYDLTLQGAWEVQDYLRGVNVPVTRQDGRTFLRGVIASPGGAVLALRPGKVGAGAPAGPVAQAPPAPAPAASAPPPALRLDEQTPYEGRLWARDGTIRLGEFAVTLDVETGGGWGGACFLAVKHGKEQQRKQCLPGQATVFHFTDRVLRVDCREAVSVYPSNVDVRVTVAPRRVEAADCRLVREPYHGQESLVLSNGLVRARLLPKLGGRLIELTTLPDETNHAVANPTLISQGAGTSWADFGGLEENAGGWPGPYWNAPFTVTVVTETADQIALRLSMEQPVEWAYGYANPKSGRNRLVKEITLRRGESRLQFDLQAYNEAQAAMPVGLRTHPVWRVGGDGGPGDHWLLHMAGKIVSKPYPFPGTFPAEGDWTALVDRPKRLALIQGYDPAAVETLYTHTSPGMYGLELWAQVREVPPGQALTLTHSLSLLQGLGGMDACRDGLALHIDTDGQWPADRNQPLVFDVEAGCVRAQAGMLTVEVWQGEKRVAALGEAALNLLPGLGAMRQFQWKPGALPDGEFDLRARFTPPGGAPLEAGRTVTLSRAGRERQLEGLAAYERQIEAIQQAYLQARKAGAPEAQRAALRERAVGAALLLAELRERIAAGEAAEAERVEQRLKDHLAAR